jgi:hypothetical protein
MWCVKKVDASYGCVTALSGACGLWWFAADVHVHVCMCMCACARPGSHGSWIGVLCTLWCGSWRVGSGVGRGACWQCVLSARRCKQRAGVSTVLGRHRLWAT